MTPQRTAAWGRSWLGLGSLAVLLPVTDEPEVAVQISHDASLASTPPQPVVWRQERAAFSLRAGGRILIARSPEAVELRLPGPTPPECVVAPHLGAAAATFATWAGGLVVHGGAFVWEGRAWALVGDKRAGKSTTLALLALQGASVLSDDVTIVASGRALAGPRCVDLREEAAATLGVGRDLGLVGTRERWRLDVADIATSVPFGGLIELRWGEPGVRSLDTAERIGLLHRHPVLPVPQGASAATLEVAADAAYSWSRPAGQTDIHRHLDLLLEAIET